MRKQTLYPFLLAFPLLIAADTPDTGPKTPAAKAALTRYVVEVKRIEDETARQKTKAAKDLVDALKKVQSDVLKAGNLAEGNAIQVEIERASLALEASPEFVVDSRLPWQVGPNLTAGRRYIIEATGTWSGNKEAGPELTCDADGTRRGWHFLEGRIGDGPTFRIGKRLTNVAKESGRLDFQMNDHTKGDNEGQLSVKIRTVN